MSDTEDHLMITDQSDRDEHVVTAEPAPDNSKAEFAARLLVARNEILAAGRIGHMDRFAAAVAAAFDVLLTA